MIGDAILVMQCYSTFIRIINDLLCPYMDSFIVLYLDDILHSIKHKGIFASYRNNARDKEEEQNLSWFKEIRVHHELSVHGLPI